MEQSNIIDTLETYQREDGQVSPNEQAVNEDSEDSNYLPLSEEEVSLGNEDFIVPEEPLEQERFKRQLIATSRSLKKKQQQLQADQDLLNDRWTVSWQPRNTASSAQPKVTRSANCYPSSMMRCWSPYHHRTMRLTDHHVVGTKRKLKPNTSPPHLTVKAEIKRFGDIHMTCGRTWTVEQVRTDQSMDHGDAPRHTTMAI